MIDLFKNYQWTAVNFVGLCLLAFVITDPFEIELLFHDTILTGGDGGSWHQIALHLKDSLIPNGRLFGWDQGNFFGYSNLQHYFVLPFLSVVLLSYVIPLTAALKIITVTGIFTLPFALYWMLRKLNYQNPIPLAGAWIILFFLFHERYSMFGANMLSTLAGEFCYGFAFTLLILFLGFLYQDIKAEKISLRSGILLGLIGLSHAFVFFLALAAPVYFLLNRPSRITIKSVLVVYLFGFLVMAFWVLPMLANLPYTTPISLNWRFLNTEEFLNNIHIETLIVAILFLLFYLNKSFRTETGIFFLFMVLCSVALYLMASILHVPDIRFFPPLLFFTLLFIMDSVATIILRLKQQKNLAKYCFLGLSIIFGGLWVYDKDNMSPDWFQWNYSGYETKPAFVDGSIKQLFNTLKGDYSDPRVAWEQGRHNSLLGTGRVFENIPLFTGRASIEGIHYASALLSLPITILNGEYSYTPASPSANIYSHFFIDSLPERFEMFNIREFISYSPEITELMKESDDFELISEHKPYHLFRWKNHNTSYVSTPKYTPLLTENYNDWKHRFKNWFRRGENNDLTLVNGVFANEEIANKLFSGNRIKLLPTGIVTDDVQKIPLQRAQITNEKIANFSMSFKTDKPGTPHIVKISYSPNWYSVNSEPIFMIAPGFMLIYPESETVELRYGRHWTEFLGIILTFTGIILALVFHYKKQMLLNVLANQLVESTVSVILNIRKPVLIMLAGLTIILSAFSYFQKQEIYGDYKEGNRLMQAGKLTEAIERYQRVTTIENIEHADDVDVPTSMYAAARLYRRIGEHELAKQELERLLYYYPRWIFVDEIYWHLGSITMETGDFKTAKKHFETCITIDRFGDNGKRCKRELDQVNTILDSKN